MTETKISPPRSLPKRGIRSFFRFDARQKEHPFFKSWEFYEAIVLGFLIAFLFHFGFFSWLENVTLDLRFRFRGPLPVSNQLVLVEISNTCLNNIGAWPWPRSYHSKLVEILKKAGAKIIGFDMIFSEKTPNDTLFASSIASAGNVILSVAPGKIVLDPESCEMVTDLQILPELKNVATGVGLISIEPGDNNRDGVFRYFYPSKTINGTEILPLGLQISSNFIGDKIDFRKLPLFTRKESFDGDFLSSLILNYYGPTGIFKSVSYEEVLNASFSHGFSLNDFQGKAVIVGPKFSGSWEDFRISPFGQVAGMEIHANIMENFLGKSFLMRFPVWASKLIILLSAILLSWFLFSWTGAFANILTGLITFLIIPGIAITLFYWGIVADIVPIIFMFPIQWASIRLMQQFVELVDRNRQLAKKVRELSIVNEVSQAVNFMGDLKKTLDKILSRAVMALGAERGSILLLDERYENLVEEAVIVGIDSPAAFNPDLKASFRIGEGIAGEVFLSGKPKMIKDIKKEKGFLPSEKTEVRVKSLICVPLQVRESPIGVMNIANKFEGDFDEEDLQLTLTMANQAAVVIEKARLFNLATIDGLTGLIVHRHFQAKIEEEFRRARRYGKPLSFIMTDIDHFKKFNDTYGHQTGDLVLREVARAVSTSIRDTDIAARYGGEEFAIILPETDEDGACLFAERLRQKVEDSVFSCSQGELTVTISLGVSAIPLNIADSALEMIKCADEALYEAKRSGRNKFMLSEKKQK
ncbi:MAG: diguanylate cyclase [Candidatus Riflebacteria bacterium]|nr:diguanylate cyclase [Candidatus Riflebacteria bacterium]